MADPIIRRPYPLYRDDLSAAEEQRLEAMDAEAFDVDDVPPEFVDALPERECCGPLDEDYPL